MSIRSSDTLVSVRSPFAAARCAGSSATLDTTSSSTVLEQLEQYPETPAAPAVLVGVDECPTHPDREALFVQFQPLVRRLLYRYGKTPELRKDLTGEIYYQFCRLVAAYDPARGIPICAYLPRMLSQTMFNYVRDYWRGESRYLPLETGEGESVERQLPAVEENWDENLVAEEVKDALPAAIARLPHRQRLVVVWRYYDARSFEEIAEQLQVKPATVRSLLRHGIAALRQQLVQDEVAAH